MLGASGWQTALLIAQCTQYAGGVRCRGSNGVGVAVAVGFGGGTVDSGGCVGGGTKRSTGGVVGRGVGAGVTARVGADVGLSVGSDVG